MEFEEMEKEIREEISESAEAEELEEELEEMELSELEIALLKSPEQRNWRETELVDIYRHPKYQAQLAFATDPDTGEALRDENGDWVHCARNTLGAQVPDGFYEDEFGIHIREAKDVGTMEDLIGYMTNQTLKRREAFGEDIDLVFAISPRFSVREAEKIQAFANKYLGVEVDYQLK